MKLENINGETVWVDKKPTPKNREKKEVLHEQALKQFHIDDPEKLYKGTHQKVIPKEWISEIISEIAKNIKSPTPSFSNYNNNQELFIFQFDNKDESSKFYDEIVEKFFKTTNAFLRERNLNPKDYYRSAVFGSEISDYQLTLTL